MIRRSRQRTINAIRRTASARDKVCCGNDRMGHAKSPEGIRKRDVRGARLAHSGIRHTARASRPRRNPAQWV